MKKFLRSTAALLTVLSLAGNQAFTATAGSKESVLVEGGDDLGESHATEYVLRRFKGERLIPVRLLGGVKTPGTYYVPQGTDLVTILSAAGGVDTNADSSKIRFNQSAGNLSSTLDLKSAMSNESGNNPVLSANDSLFIEQKTPLISTNTLLLLTTASLLISIALGVRQLTANQPTVGH